MLRDLRRAHSKYQTHSNLLRFWHMKPDDHRYRQDQDQQIGDDVGSGSGEVNASFVNAFEVGNAEIPIRRNRLTGKYQRKDDTDTITDDNGHQRIYADVEPLELRDLAI